MTPRLRSFAWRLGRSIYRWARREGDNEPTRNGEYWLLDLVVNRCDEQPVILMDIGANKGDWSAAAVRALHRHAKRGEIHAFEPTAATFDHLSSRFANVMSITPHRLALSDRSGESRVYVVAALSGRNSLHPVAGASVERAPIGSLDAFVADHGIAHIALVKSDAEGHDMTILEGGKKSLEAGRIDVWQFEYNHRWLSNRASLWSVFQFIEQMPYSLGKLYGNGIEIYDRWHFELDRFIETNYVLIRRDAGLGDIARAVRFNHANTPVAGSWEKSAKS